MNPTECEVCGEKEPSIIHTIYKEGVYRGRCTDCLLKEHRQLFCPFCFKATTERSDRTTCLKCCYSMAHVACLPLSSSSSSLPPPESAFTCPPCTDPKFTFFPKSSVNIDISDLSVSSAHALVAATTIAAGNLEHAEAQLKEECSKMTTAVKEAKRKAEDALKNLAHVLCQKTSPIKTTDS